MFRGGVRWVACAAAAAGLVLAASACTEDSSPPADSIDGAEGGGGVAGSGGVSSSTAQTVVVTDDDPSPDALEAVAAVPGAVPDSEPVIRCVAQQLDRNVDLRDALSVEPLDEGRLSELSQLGMACTRAAEIAPRWVANISAQVPGGLSSETRRCVEVGLAQLPVESWDTIVGGGLDPSAVDPSGEEVFKQVLAPCGVELSNIADPP